jgi:phage FluMu protein Com
MNNQFEILQRMQQDGYNVVTCGNCGDVVLLELNVVQRYLDVQCPHCKETMEYCDMPDLYTR